MRKRKIFQLGKGNHSNQKKENIPIRKRKSFQLEKGKYYQSEIGNREMTEEEEEEQEQEEQEDKNKRIRPRERARGQQHMSFVNLKLHKRNYSNVYCTQYCEHS